MVRLRPVALGAQRPETFDQLLSSRGSYFREFHMSFLLQQSRVALLVLGFATIAQNAVAQDTRRVREPSIPPACASLQAKIGRPGLSIYPDDETRFDPARIQAAIDACSPG